MNKVNDLTAFVVNMNLHTDYHKRSDGMRGFKKYGYYLFLHIRG